MNAKTNINLSIHEQDHVGSCLALSCVPVCECSLLQDSEGAVETQLGSHRGTSGPCRHCHPPLLWGVVCHAADALVGRVRSVSNTVVKAESSAVCDEMKLMFQ